MYQRDYEMFGVLASFIAVISGSTLLIRNWLCSTQTSTRTENKECRGTDDEDQREDHNKNLKEFRNGKHRIRLYKY